MTDTQWIMLLTFIAYVCLVAIAFKYPRTRENWGKDRRESLQLMMSFVIFIMLFLTLWYISYVVDWPDAIVIIIWSCAFIFLGLILIGIFAPQGINLRFDKKTEIKTADDDDN